MPFKKPQKNPRVIIIIIIIIIINNLRGNQHIFINNSTGSGLCSEKPNSDSLTGIAR